VDLSEGSASQRRADADRADTSRWDLVIIGAGAVGSAAFRTASSAGARVLCLEQFEPGHGSGSSHGHSRIFRHAYFEHPDYVPLLRHSTARFESLGRESEVPLLHRCGMLVAGPRDSQAVQGSLAASRRWSLPVEEITGTEITSRFPWFSLPPDSIAAFESDAGILRSEAAIAANLAVATARGGTLRSGVRVRELSESGSGVTVRTDGRLERAASVIVAAGAWAARLLPDLAPLLTVTRQVQAWVAPATGVDPSSMPCWFVDRGQASRAIYGLAPDPLAGSGDHAVRARQPKLGLHGSDEIVDPDLGARPVCEDDLTRLRVACEPIAPGLAADVADAATCLYTMSPDGQFLVGARGRGRIVFAAGLSGHGFKLSPALGDALVDLALTGRTALPVAFLSPSRFL
jgi:sarcosine oxidase